MEPKIKRVLLVRPNYQVSAASLERTLNRMNSELQNGSVVVLPADWKATVVEVDIIKTQENS
jgi:hypothetical protein